ncbi:Dimethyl-sulfide monooxygenase [Venturia nashicola]|uniref:Dimethyl-sulfide monooxygenase n=1 Tax=Venturia nashicola TaxID=86259 RepID=A0A4Z1NF92_9PEZI|nr:Dimethyl-sulfide monooxygenase [Venturia nashicola]TLD19527.1 Dimethyl-sulfide monooxygenase [Venturia nashicola]
MATAAHCAYCFEVLSSALEKRQPLSFREVEDLWDRYEVAAAGEAGVPEDEMDVILSPPPTAAISRILKSPSTSSSASSSTPSLSTVTDTSESSSTSSLSSLHKGSSSSKGGASDKKYPLFVTWDTIGKGGHKSLRGCIGTFEDQELDDGLRSYALTSAFEDHRFDEISLRELPNLGCGVTLLTDFESIKDPMEWTVGTHGLRISFTDRNRRFGSTYLPDVAREQGWTKEETMISLMRKAGWSSKSSDWRNVKDLKVVRYRGHRHELGYKEYSEWRHWVEETGRAST